LVARLLGAALALRLPGALRAFAIEEKDVFKRTACPALLLFENAAYLADMTFELPCNCKPEDVTSVVWYFQKDEGSHQTTVLTDFAGTVVVDSGHIHVGSDVLKRFSIRMFSLIVFRAQVRDSGLYLCGTKKGDFFYGYDVDVQSTRGITVAFADKGQHARDDYARKAFSLFTAFWEWSKCDRCGVRGEQRRIGLCYVQSARLHPRYRSAVPNVTSCGSRAVPARFPRPGRLRGPEVLVRSCLAPCPREAAAPEGVQAVADIVSKLGEKPSLPAVPTQLHTHPAGRALVIACPGARPEHAVAWDKGPVRLYRSRYLRGVNRSMRVFIDHGNHLHILRVRRGDGGTYYCWREGRVVAAFRLSVTYESRHRRTLDDPETKFAIQIILTSYVLVTIVFFGIHLCRCCRRLFWCPPGT
ncbi:F187A protein, partial [Nothocercus nigrocapillus]|nr:F187A protein [Nothocercus nigrocapillus]